MRVDNSVEIWNTVEAENSVDFGMLFWRRRILQRFENAVEVDNSVEI